MPRRLVHPELGPMIRLASWNIEDATELDSLITAITSSIKYAALIDPERAPVGSEAYQNAITQRSILAGSDVLVLQQTDIGMRRSRYRNSVKEIAKTLGMNYAFAPEQVEVNPEKALGLSGSAVFSRYPIKDVKVFPLVYQVSGSQTARRIFMRVDLNVPELPDETLTVININLESDCEPQDREIQLREILTTIRDIKHPVVLAGNFNSASGNLTQFTFGSDMRRAATDPNVLATPVISVFVPAGVVVNAASRSINLGKNFHNPTSGNIPILAPNRAKGLFDELEFFRFADGGAFDFRGTPARSFDGKINPLANSNERMGAGFKTTFDTYQSLYNISGAYRLDWIFVKPVGLTHPFDNHASFRCAPHFGATLKEMNTSLTRPISNHSPNVVDLPLQEPTIDEKIESSFIKPVKKPGMKG
ncbi:MAG: hypothetical protein HZC17_07065 [Candidatus Omnitrophica bacterium]|nr:hypothetical protein [Candidatus Omnitrophota bacterium]